MLHLLFLSGIIFLNQTERHEHFQLIGIYLSAFTLLFILIKYQKSSFFELIILSLASRLLLWDYFPALSQDFYRFIWDGMLNAKGFNVYVNLPQTLWENFSIEHNQFTETLYRKMGKLSAHNYTNYPPFAQLIYTLLYKICGENITTYIYGLRIVNWLAEIGIFWFMWQLMRHFKINLKSIFWLILNPLILLELTGNLHFEAVMLCFFLGFLYFFLVKKRYYLSILLLSLSIVSKLLPLIILPLILSYRYHKNLRISILKGLFLCSQTLILSLISYLYFVDQQLISSYSESLGLWFSTFEFNASIYYVLREIGYWMVGYNAIAFIGKLLAAVIFFTVMCISFWKYKQNKAEEFLKKMSVIFLIYFLLATTVHPWYLILPLSLGIINRNFLTKQLLLIWSATIILSYISYKTEIVKEPTIILIVEYSLIYLIILKYLFLRLRKRLNTSYSANTKT
ncbi:hypothetical protein SAMN05444278_11048 [Psychroflexus salarius]|uniref:Mannosyltransferase n=1 Tax=Psychroflexus salarius TaxID=1155689 RepID=A0A1M4XSN2_9FLAO|nr:polyprenol phosphomannose-dependent alpha 1,6 mannosyltransferase MptB [Psychroflexus salarius]SHE96465.1 hypothetical protein SAMN05444278_11048 [Psychroflexus salarius]